MTNDKINRVKNVDVESLTDVELEQIIDRMSDKINTMVDETCEKANNLLGVYGLEAKMKIVFVKKPDEDNTDKEQ